MKKGFRIIQSSTGVSPYMGHYLLNCRFILFFSGLPQEKL